MNYGKLRFGYIFLNYSPNYVLIPNFQVYINCVEEKLIPLIRNPPYVHKDDYSLQFRFSSSPVSRERYNYNKEKEENSSFFDQNIQDPLEKLLISLLEESSIEKLDKAVNIQCNLVPFAPSPASQINLVILSICAKGIAATNDLAYKIYERIPETHIEKEKFKDLLEKVLLI